MAARRPKPKREAPPVNWGAIDRQRRQKGAAQAAREAPQAQPAPPDMTGAPQIINCDIGDGKYGIYAPNGGRAQIRGTRFADNEIAIEAGGNARFELEDCDIE
jgi:hypothetical protein